MTSPDTWSFEKITRAFGRYFDDEREQLTAEAVTAGEIVKRFLYTLGEASSFRSPKIRADALMAIDKFAAARKL